MSDTVRRVACIKWDDSLSKAIRRALEWIGWERIVPRGARVAIKPNLSSAKYKPGVTTSPEVLRAFLEILKERTDRIAVVEADGSCGVHRVTDAFSGHGYDSICEQLGVEMVDLGEGPVEKIPVEVKGNRHWVPLPRRLLHDTDVFVTVPVPKVHAMTYLSLAYKNQWGCVPDIMRLRYHHIFDDAIVAINRALKPRICLGDGTYFLDRQGPIEGRPVRMNLIIAATDPGTFCAYVSRLMKMDWRRAPHLRRAVQLGDMPESLDGIEMNLRPEEVSSRQFVLRRSFRNCLVLPAFRNGSLTYLYYESPLGLFAHKILYFFVGGPEGEKSPEF
jgi:uncharacterized protein (DUF362 family)